MTSSETYLKWSFIVMVYFPLFLVIFFHLFISLVISSACIEYDFKHALPGIINGFIALPSAGQ